MAVQVLDYSVNVSLSLDEILDLQRDFNEFTNYTAAEGRPTINPGFAPLQHQPAPHTHNPIQRATKRKRIDGESSTNSVPATTHSSAETPAPKKRPRAKIRGERKLILEGIFAESQFIVGKQRRDLAASLGLTDNQVGHWFEYRRRSLRGFHKRNNANTVWLPGHVDAFDANPPTICAVSQGLVTPSSPQFSFAPTNSQTNYSASLDSNTCPSLTWQQGYYYDASPPYSSYTSNTPSVRQDFRSPSGDFSSPSSVGSSFASYETSSLWPDEVLEFLSENCAN